jgi:hypothetical protein
MLYQRDDDVILTCTCAAELLPVIYRVVVRLKHLPYT